MKEFNQPLPGPVSIPIPARRRKFKHSRRTILRVLTFLFTLSITASLFNNGVLQYPLDLFPLRTASLPSPSILKHRHKLLERCKSIHTHAGPPRDYQPESRIIQAYNTTNGNKPKGSDRFVQGTSPVLIKNAKIWTGQLNGTWTIYGDVLLDKGLVIAVGHVPRSLLDELIPENSEDWEKMVVIDVEGKWVTPGLVDLHSHIGVSSAPELKGARDVNSHKAPILPWLRSIDGLNTHDESYRLAIAGGVTTAQVLPGSANNIGGQAFLIKLRPTAEGSASSKVLEPPEMLHYPNASSSGYTHWRHMKHACGENPDRVYSQSRMDAAWNFRNAYNEALKIKSAQDQFCKHAEAGEWDIVESGAIGHKKHKHDKLPEFPESLQWESLVDVLRGRVKLSVHCYEAVDLDMIVRLSNEFQFPVASFHHAGETYLVPDLLKKTWGGVPTIALFASNFRKKREAYRGSEFAPRILADQDVPVVMKSDHPVMNSRYLLYEAQLAHYHGLSTALALSSVTSVPARAAGVGHRVGTIAQGYDADIAIWDSHPLRIGATPMQVFIDGIPQLDDPHIVWKPPNAQETPANPNWDCEAKNAVKWDGLPPLQGHKRGLKAGEAIRFERVKSAWITTEDGAIVNAFKEDEDESIAKGGSVIIQDGKIICIENKRDSCEDASVTGDLVIDLNGGSLAPGLTTFGSPLGLVEILMEASTNDGDVFDPLTDGKVPDIIGNKTVVRAVDGLKFAGRDTLLAYRNGVTTAISAPQSKGFLHGLSAAFDTGSSNSLERGAIVQEETALHVTINPSLSVSVSTQLATLRRLVFSDVGGSIWFRVRKGEIPLVVHVDSADIMATLVKLKTDYEDVMDTRLRLTFAGAAEAHLVADKIAEARVSVIVTLPRPYPGTWDKSRFLPGPPLSSNHLVSTLLEKGVTVAIGTVDQFSVRHARFEIAWAGFNSNGKISPGQAIALVTTNLEHALGLERRWNVLRDIAIYKDGGVFDVESKVYGILSVRKRVLETFACEE
ncbi:hypothetical protein JOM56_003159 [Amanita muscaria]